MTNWKEYKLNDLVTKLGDGLHGTPKYDPNGEYYFINGSNLIDGKISVNENTKRVTKEEFEKYKKELTDRTIFVSINGTLGNIATYNNEKVVLGKSACYFNVKEDVSKEFIKYIVTAKSFQNYIYEYATGTTIKNVPLKAIRDYTFKLPDLPTQTAIAEILSSLDDKIELNNKINQELENLAQTLFKQWFIDFEFPVQLSELGVEGLKDDWMKKNILQSLNPKNPNSDTYRSSGGEMVDSELGEIPKGWEVKKLNEFVNCYDSKRVPLSSQQRTIRKGSYPYYGAASLMDYVDDYLFDGVYVLMGEDGSVTDSNGYPVLQYVFGQFWVNNHAHVLQGTTISTELIMCLLKNTNISHLVTGAVQPKLNQGNMNKISLAIPNDTIILFNLEINIKSIYESVRNNTKENQELTNLRDTLLPKLISGELEVNNVKF